MALIRRCRFYFFISCIILFFNNCEPIPYLWYANSYETGRILKKGEKEVSVHTLLYVPFNGSFTIGLSDQWQLRAGVGQVGEIIDEAPILGGELTLTRKHIEHRFFRTSASLGVDGYITPYIIKDDVDKFYGTEIFSSYTLGFSPTRTLTAFFPLRMNYINARWRNRSSSGFAITPGFGLSIEPGHFLIQGMFNQPVAVDYPLTPKVGDIFLFYYLGLGIGYRW